MKNYNLGFISNNNLFEVVKSTIDRYSSKITLQSFNKNLIDPIKLTFDAKVYSRKWSDVVVSETIRQMDKTNSNAIGFFHQQLFANIGGGWEVPKAGFDIVNEERHIYVELKNKHNTMNSSSSQKTYMKMQRKLLRDAEATCMLVEVIAKKSQDVTWNTLVDGEHFSNKKIRRVSIDKFYELVFGDALAFFKLCKVLPDVIDDVLISGKAKSITNTVLAELKKLSPDIKRSLFLMAFKTYEGFDKL